MAAIHIIQLIKLAIPWNDPLHAFWSGLHAAPAAMRVMQLITH